MSATEVEPQTPATEGPAGDNEAFDLDAAGGALFHWADAISSGKVEKVLDLYAPDAILVPTLTDEICVHGDERRRYFEFLLSNGSPRCTIDLQKCQVSPKPDTVVIGGLYTFLFLRGDLKERVPARFLFIFEKIEERWLITGHHSSRLIGPAS